MQAILLAALVIAGCARPGPARVGVDAAHDNYHTVDGRYRPFAELLRRQGFVVRGVTGRLDPASLGALDVLVIANATIALDADELAATARWVRGGGALWLIADHAPFGGIVGPLARAFGVEMSNGLVGDEAHRWEGADDPGNIVYARGAGLVADHPIVHGVARVVTFVGQSLRGPPSATVVLALSRTAREMLPPDRHLVSATGRAQALAFAFGRGRVYISGEAAMFTEQTKPDGSAMGMNAPGNDDRQLTINIARWLARRIGP